MLRFVIATLALTICANAQAAKDTWTVKGTVKVDHGRLGTMASAFGQKQPLQNIQVKVSARTKVLGVWGTWNSWKTVHTGSNGVFSVKKEKNNSKRQFKVEVKFDDDDLEIRHETATSSLTKVKWYTIYKGSKEWSRGTCDIGTKVFNDGNPEDLGDWEARRHAEIWNTMKKYIAAINNLGSDVAFKSKVKMKYPHNSLVVGSSEASYVNPTTKVLYLHRTPDGSKDHCDVQTMAHELGHVWAFTHCTGEFGMTKQLIAHGDTHRDQEKSFVAFHEGFAERFHDFLMEEVFGSAPYELRSRNGLTGQREGTVLKNPSMVEKSDDPGWRNALNMMTTHDLQSYDFNASGTTATRRSAFAPSCKCPQLTFKNVLTVFNAHPSKGHPKIIGKNELNFDDFFHRAADILPGLTRADGNKWQKLMDRRETVSAKELFCDGLRVRKADPIVRKTPAL